jgi:hypothetical protein
LATNITNMFKRGQKPFEAMNIGRFSNVKQPFWFLFEEKWRHCVVTEDGKHYVDGIYTHTVNVPKS